MMGMDNLMLSQLILVETSIGELAASSVWCWWHVCSITHRLHIPLSIPRPCAWSTPELIFCDPMTLGEF